MGAAVAAGAAIAAIGSMLFAAFQTRSLATQTKLLRASSELSFNLAVMVRLQEVLFEIADDRQSREMIWPDDDGLNARAGVATQSLLDVLSMAIAAVDRLPGFSRNSDDWSSYTEFVLGQSPATRRLALDNPEWWPEVTPYAHRVAVRGRVT